MVPTGSDFQEALKTLFDDALKSGQPFVVVKADELHAEVVGGKKVARRGLCVGVMRHNCRAQDEILKDSRDGRLVVRYRLPRAQH